MKLSLFLVILCATLAAVGAGFGCLLGMGLAELRASLEPVTGFTWFGTKLPQASRCEKKSGCITIERRSVSSVPPRPVT